MVERLDTDDDATRSWTGNDDSGFQHHGVIALSESPLVLAVSWRPSSARPARSVGCFRLDLRRLLDGDFVRTEGRGKVRLRFFHAGDAGVYVQRRLNTPRYLVGRV